MDRRIRSVFGNTLRGDFLTSDGRLLHPKSFAMRKARELIATDAAGFADEIIKLMKPFCRPFDIPEKRARLIEMGRRQASQRKSDTATRRGARRSVTHIVLFPSQAVVQ